MRAGRRTPKGKKPLTMIRDGILCGAVTGELVEVLNPRTRPWRLDRWALWLVATLTGGRVGAAGRLRFYNTAGDEVDHWVRRTRAKLPGVPSCGGDER